MLVIGATFWFKKPTAQVLSAAARSDRGRNAQLLRNLEMGSLSSPPLMFQTFTTL